jgi:hypothetical protein
LAGLLRPSGATYAALADQSGANVRRASTWVLVAALAGGLIDTLAPFFGPIFERSYFDVLLLAAIPLSALIAVAYFVAFAGCIYAGARLLKGEKGFGRLVYAFAAFSAPLIVVASVLALLPQSRALLIALYLYWMALYVVATRAVGRLSLLKATAAVLAALLALGAAWLGIAFVIGYWGVLLP